MPRSKPETSRYCPCYARAVMSTMRPQCFAYACAQAKRGLTGIMNYTNPGAISHNEILELYKCYVDSDFTWKNFSVEEQAKVIVAPRSNNLLDTARVSPRSASLHASLLDPLS